MQNSNVSKKLKEKAKRFGAALTTLSSSMKQHMEHAKQVAENTKVGQALKSDVEATVKEAFAVAAGKLPVKVRFISRFREDDEES